MKSAEAAFAEALDQRKHFALVRRLTEGIEIPNRRAMVDLYLEHTRAELIDCEIDALMATLAPEPEYIFLGMGEHAPPALRGVADVRAFYLTSFRGGANQGALNEIDRVVVTDDVLILEGVNTSSGARLASMYPEVADFIDTSRTCVVRKRLAAILPFSEGRIAGERLYFDGFYRPEEVQYFD